MADIIEKIINQDFINDEIKDDDIREQAIELKTDYENEQQAKKQDTDDMDHENLHLKIMKAKITLDDKREFKIPVAPDKVEKIIKDFMQKYDIENKFNQYFQQRISAFHNDENAEIIIKNALGKYDEYIFDVDFFQSLVDWVREQINNFVKQEFESDPNMDKDKRIVLENLDIHIDLTVHKAGIDKMTLIAWHYFLKNLEKMSRDFIKKYKDKLVGYNKQKIAIELYNKEISNILSNHPQMRAFTNTIVSITQSWIQKYHAKSTKLSKFIYELQLSDMHVILNTIVRYLILIAIKNRNPIELRALMSTYISLIHRNIISLLSADITKVKIGYIAAVQYMFEEGEQAHFVYDKQQMISQALANVFKSKNKRKIKKYKEQFDIFKYLSEINVIDFAEFANPEYSVLDNMYLYVILGADLENSDNEYANSFVFSSKYKVKKNYQPVKKYFEFKYADELKTILQDITHHEETAKVFFNRFKNHILRAVNPNYYVHPEKGKLEPDTEYILKTLDIVAETTIKELKKESK